MQSLKPDKQPSLETQVKEVMQQTQLYCSLIKVPEMAVLANLSSDEACIIGPKTNYVPDKMSRTAIGISQDAVEIILKDVKVDNQSVMLNGYSTYDFELTRLVEDQNGVRVEGKLGQTYDFGLGQEGKNYSGSTICGYVDKIERQKDEPGPQLPDFEF